MKKILIAIIVILIGVVGFLLIPKEKEKVPTPQIDPVESGILQEFTKISELPKQPGDTRVISNYLRSWAKENNYKVTVDKVNNIIIEKPASSGYENAPTTILQGHMNTALKNESNTSTKGAVHVISDGAVLTAKDTELGSDGSASIATALYLLKSTEKHGSIKAILTIDADSNTHAAEKLDPKYLEGDYLINIDSEQDRVLCNGSASLTSYDMSRALTWVKPRNENAFEVAIHGLQGGDSGDHINENHANAIKILGTLFAQAQSQGIVLELASFNGGTDGKEIPSDATAVVILNQYDVKKFQSIYNTATSDFKSDFGNTEKNATFTLTPSAITDKVLSKEDSNSIISYLYGIVNGVNSTTASNDGMVESSSNIGTAYTHTGNFSSMVLVRSSSQERSVELTTAHDKLAKLCNITYTISSNEPGWPMKENSTLTPEITSIYQKLFQQKVAGKPIHSSSELGWFASKNPNLDMISMGPFTGKSLGKDEKLYLNSMIKPAKVILNFLEKTKEKPEVPNVTDSSITTGNAITSGNAINLPLN